MTNEQRDRVMEIARNEIGTREEPKGSNWGPRVSQYLQSVGIRSPAAWCAAFVHWVFGCALPPVKNPLPKTGRCSLIHRWAREQKRIVKPENAEPGDLVLFWFPSLNRAAHIAIVGRVQFLADGPICWTVEGNTNDEGSREGYEVARRRRRVTRNMIFVSMELR
jgi:hypothetical protein